ncbi:MAG TPA: hypothetical protein VGF67_16010 [Ktedonobacteraceae bacterium]
MARYISDLPYIHEHTRNRVIVTTRIIGYEGQLNAYDFQVLYRDCVEILAEQWQRSKHIDDRESTTYEDLRLSQKLVLLQAIALYMQQQREAADRQTLIPQAKAQAIARYSGRPATSGSAGTPEGLRAPGRSMDQGCSNRERHSD